MSYLKTLINLTVKFNKNTLIKCVNVLFKFNKLIRKLFLNRIKRVANITELELVRCSILEYVIRNLNMSYNDICPLANLT